MILLELTTEEQQVLLQMMENTIADLHSEIIRTENVEYKETLKRQKAMLNRLRDSLINPVPSALAPAGGPDIYGE